MSRLVGGVMIGGNGLSFFELITKGGITKQLLFDSWLIQGYITVEATYYLALILIGFATVIGLGYKFFKWVTPN